MTDLGTTSRVLGGIHGRHVYDRRTRILARAVARLLPPNSRVLDVGSGDGTIASMVMQLGVNITIEGIDTLVRPSTQIPVVGFDGMRLPFEDGSFDAVTFVDVLHHTEDPMILLREAARVSRRFIVIKDHRRDGLLAQPTLHFMDWVGNAKHGVVIPANYWPERCWREAFNAIGTTVTSWSTSVSLYPFWASWVFGRRLHFVARLEKQTS